MVNNRSMAAQHNHTNAVGVLETSVSDGAHLGTPKVDILKRKIQDWTANMQLLMEQNREIMLELRGRRSTPSDGDAGQLGSHVPSGRSQDQVREDESASASRFQESRHEERACIPGSWEEKMDDVKKEMALMREELKGKAPTTVDELIQRTDHPFTTEVMA